MDKSDTVFMIWIALIILTGILLGLLGYLNRPFSLETIFLATQIAVFVLIALIQKRVLEIRTREFVQGIDGPHVIRKWSIHWHQSRLTLRNRSKFVCLGASAPKSARKGSKFTARFVAHTRDNEELVHDLLANISPRSIPHLALKEVNWKLGTVVKILLTGDHLKVTEPEQTFVWNGRYNIVDFDIEVPPDAPLGFTILMFDASISDLIVARLRLDLSISVNKVPKELKSVFATSAHTAFASYACEDRLRVLDRIDEINRAGMDVFLDCLSMKPGEQWKTRIEKEIRRRERFLLFWSHNALNSEWVKWEWKTALRQKGKAAMEIHPLEPVFNAPPPEELSDLHFGTYFMLARDSYNNSAS